MPAVMMTKVMPMAMMPVSDTARTMLAMLSGLRNRISPWRRGEKMMPPIATSTRPIRLWKRTISASGSRCFCAAAVTGLAATEIFSSDIRPPCR
nr:hypothetical protein [Mesorhizobium sp. LNJC384A00]